MLYLGHGLTDLVSENPAYHGSYMLARGKNDQETYTHFPVAFMEMHAFSITSPKYSSHA